jgi:hypothetical protein
MPPDDLFVRMHECMDAELGAGAASAAQVGVSAEGLDLDATLQSVCETVGAVVREADARLDANSARILLETVEWLPVPTVPVPWVCLVRQSQLGIALAKVAFEPRMEEAWAVGRHATWRSMLDWRHDAGAYQTADSYPRVASAWGSEDYVVVPLGKADEASEGGALWGAMFGTAAQALEGVKGAIDGLSRTVQQLR